MGLAFTFPAGDWQFWAVSACALAALVYLLRNVLFGTRLKKRRRGQRVPLTINRKTSGD